MTNLRDRFQYRIIVQDIRKDLDPGKPHTEKCIPIQTMIWQKWKSSAYRAILGRRSPLSEIDKLSEKVIGSLMYQTHIDFKPQEWNDYHNHVSDWELQRYLKFF
jgi:glutamine synthetase